MIIDRYLFTQIDSNILAKLYIFFYLKKKFWHVNGNIFFRLCFSDSDYTVHFSKIISQITLW